MLPSPRDLFGASSDFIFQQDGATCHTDRVCTRRFQQHNVQLLTWPGNSPDLSPIENLWSRLKRLMMLKWPGNKTSLIEAIISSWFRVITSAELNKIVDSMHRTRRCKAVIKAKGYPMATEPSRWFRYFSAMEPSRWFRYFVAMEPSISLFLSFMPTKDLAPFSIHTPQKPSSKPINDQFIVAAICWVQVSQPSQPTFDFDW